MQVLVNIDVPDLPAAEALYTRAFGLKPHRRFGSEGVELLGAQAPIYLLQNATGTAGAGDSKRDYARHWTPLHLDVVVDALEPALDRALEAGFVQEGGIRDNHWGRIVQLCDPWGHGWCLLQFSDAGYDAVATRGP